MRGGMNTFGAMMASSARGTLAGVQLSGHSSYTNRTQHEAGVSVEIGAPWRSAVFGEHEGIAGLLPYFSNPNASHFGDNGVAVLGD